MFKKKSKQPTEADGIASKTITTETVSYGGVKQTTTSTVITGSTREEIESAFNHFRLDQPGMTNSMVTKKVVHTTTDGGKEIIEEITETYDDGSTGHVKEPCRLKDTKTSKPLSEKLGLKIKTKETPKCDGVVPTCMKASKFEEDCLKSHNAYRKQHGVPNLKLSKELCTYAKEWADHLAATDSFQHRSQRTYGENIYMKWSSDPCHAVEGHDAVDSWYSEIKDHVFGKEPTSLKSGHFTQVIWKDSTEVGVAWARSKSGKVLVVANYKPAGNFVGKFAVNVPSLKK